MSEHWSFSVWGVRGSAPTPAVDHLMYGGNTSCFLLERGGEHRAALALDAGTGLAAAGGALLRKGVRRLDLLISHCHLDHLLGLVSLPLLCTPGAELVLYGAPGLKEALRGLLAAPYWPVSIEQAAARLRVIEHPAGAAFALEDGAVSGWPELTVQTMEGCHPGGSCLYRLSGEGHSLVYTLDCELAGDTAERMADFAKGADLLVWDAGFAPDEVRRGWGHSSWAEGLAVGRCAGVKTVLMSHYHTDYDDPALKAQERAAVQADSRCRFAKEGMVIEL